MYFVVELFSIFHATAATAACVHVWCFFSVLIELIHKNKIEQAFIEVKITTKNRIVLYF